MGGPPFNATKSSFLNIDPHPPTPASPPLALFSQFPSPSLKHTENRAAKIVMGAVFSSSKKTKELEMARNKAKEIVSSFQVVVFSKTHCGYCTRVKQLLTQLGASFRVIELDNESEKNDNSVFEPALDLGDGDDIQAALAQWTGQRTVPNVFIGGKHIGGCDSVVAKHQAGELMNLLTNAGAIPNSATAQQ